MPEQDQVRLLAGLGSSAAPTSSRRCSPTTPPTCSAEMPAEQRERLLTAMQSVQAADLRRLLRYDATTAGGLMTSQPLIFAPDAPVAEVLARIRDPDLPATAAAQVYVCEPPTVTPTGRYLGSVGFQRLLRRPPSILVGECIEASVFVRPELPEHELAARLAAYNLIGVAVCDEGGRLLGAVTVDDVLDRLLPAGWRRTGRTTMARMLPSRRRRPLRPVVPAGAPRLGARYDADAFGRFSEALARFLGTGRYLVGQTVLVIIWIVLNTVGIIRHWDPYPFILLNLAFSTQAAYAAPLILLAQNRQDERDRATIERDRQVAARTQADTEYLARELAAVRLALDDMVTNQDLDDSLSRLAKLDREPAVPGRARPAYATERELRVRRSGDQVIRRATTAGWRGPDSLSARRYTMLGWR